MLQEKAKAKIERDFLAKLSNELDSKLENQKFYFSGESNILVEKNHYDVDVDINKDIELILQKRQARSLDVSKNEYEKTVQLTGSVLIYTNNEYNKEINLYIIKDPFGLNIIIDQVTGENTVHRNSYEIDDSNILHSSNINKLLDNKYMSDNIKKYCEEIIKILNDYLELNYE